MEHSTIVLLISGALLLVIATGFDFARRQFTKKRNDYRIGQALRRGLSQSCDPWTHTTQMLELQSCEPSSAHWS